MMVCRPTTFDDFHGQSGVIKNLRVLVTSAQRQAKPLAHLLLVGPAGLGKSTVGLHVLPREMGVEARFINCAAIDRPQQLTSVLATARANQILFLDELHALPKEAREHLLTAMEDQTISVAVGEPPNETVMSVRLQPFTIVGATTRQGVLDAPLRTRFQQSLRLEPYTDQEMSQILAWHAQGNQCSYDRPALDLLATCAKGVARSGVNLLNSAVDTAVAETGEVHLDTSVARSTLDRLGYHGLFNPDELRYLRYLLQAGRAGLSTLTVALDETASTIEEVYEPWLLRQGLIIREPSGRRVTEAGQALLHDPEGGNV